VHAVQDIKVIIVHNLLQNLALIIVLEKDHVIHQLEYVHVIQDIKVITVHNLLQNLALIIVLEMDNVYNQQENVFVMILTMETIAENEN
jgi:hypothetical protein